LYTYIWTEQIPANMTESRPTRDQGQDQASLHKGDNGEVQMPF